MGRGQRERRGGMEKTAEALVSSFDFPPSLDSKSQKSHFQNATAVLRILYGFIFLKKIISTQAGKRN